jgi:hypothetical protein
LKQTLSQEALILENPSFVASLRFIASVLQRQKKREGERELHVLLRVFLDRAQLQEIGLDLRS